MCGICGFVSKRGAPDLAVLRAMSAALTHRGPDDAGEFADGAVALGTRRLAVIDLPGGRQPMTTRDGRFTLAYNGEAYNFEDLRREIAADWRTRSDTEVVLELLARRGVDGLPRIDGMFALALYDREDGSVTLARDRFGEKPLYWADLGDRVLFASELTALRPHVSGEIDETALAEYLAFDAVPSPRSILRDARKVPPGGGVRIARGRVEPFAWWSPPAPRNVPVPFEEAVERTRDLLRASVKRRLVADVPAGVFLSGGVDSAAIAAIAAEAHSRIRAFTVGFEDASYDETPHARRVAERLGLPHEVEVLPAAAMPDVLPLAAAGLDEPLADASILPTLLLSRFARRHVTVALGGDGGDEVFAGYPTFLAYRVARPLLRIPRAVWPTLRALADRLPVSRNYLSFDFKLKRFLRGMDQPADRMNQVWLGALGPAEVKEIVPRWSGDPLDPIDRHLVALSDMDDLHRLQALYFRFYLADQVLAKVDRASMSASLEVRAPFLGHDVFSFLWHLPVEMQWRGTSSKRILKAVLRDLVPREVLRRPKHGFAVPVSRWLAGPLAGLMRETVSHMEMFDRRTVDRWVTEHISGRRDHGRALWSLLAFELWRQGERSNSSRPANSTDR